MDPTAASFLLDTLWDVIKGVLGNRADAALFSGQDEQSAGRPPVAQDPQLPAVGAGTAVSKASPKFKTFDFVNDFAYVLPLVEQPLMHLLIEAEPSTAYNLAAFVLESRTTGQWYVFGRGRIALQGSGGGHNNLTRLVDELRRKQTPIAAWVVGASDLNSFEQGIVLWPEFRGLLVPLIAHISQGDAWPGIQNRFRELVPPTAG